MQSSHENRTELIQTDADEYVVDEDVTDEDLKRTTAEILISEIVQRSNIAAKGKQNGTSILETTEEQVLQVDVDDSNETKNSSLEIQSVHGFSANTSRYRLRRRHKGNCLQFLYFQFC